MKGKEGFLQYYGDQVKLLDFNPTPILLIHPKFKNKLLFSSELLEWYPGAWLWPKEFPVGTTLPGYTDRYFYVMNAASLKPVLVLNPKPSETILDACAAPGGKAVAIAHRLNNIGQLYCNDSSVKRLYRLKAILQPLGYHNIALWCTKSETIYKKYSDFFDGILLDAPCSSEQHVWHSPKHLAQWSESRIKRLKQQQIALLNGLWLALKPGGRIVYATCALNTEENERVIEDFQERHPEAIITQQERITPDETLFDPMFYARIEKPTL